MSIAYPLFVFDKSDRAMRLIEEPERLFFHLEEIDIENDEYLFWDANGTRVRVRIIKRKSAAVENCEAAKPLSEAFLEYGQSLGLAIDVSGRPLEIWDRMKHEIKRNPKRKGPFAIFRDRGPSKNK